VNAAIVNHDLDTAQELIAVVESFGLPIQAPGLPRRYAFGLVPVRDAFIAWTNALHLKTNLMQPVDSGTTAWKLTIHLGTIVFLVLLALAWIHQPRWQASKQTQG
jgi:hypothetical protein